MKMMVLHGSPRKNANSDTLTEYFIKGVREIRDSELDYFFINDLMIRPCQGCLFCETSVDLGCAIKDDMQEIYSAYIDADIIFWATPMRVRRSNDKSFYVLFS